MKRVGLLMITSLAATAAACSDSKPASPPRTGGTVQGVGGGTGVAGTGGASPGTGGTIAGVGGATGVGGGNGVGGLVVPGNGGSGRGGVGGAGSGGNLSGTGGRGTGGGSSAVGTGGSGAGAAGFGAGGLGTGGKATGGAGGKGTGGSSTGGATGWDGGAGKCSDLTTQAACDTRSDCHSVFVDPGNCACAALGCCARFQACADGDKADCTGPALCKMMEPYCEGPYVIAFEGSCYEGCVKRTDCAEPACPKAVPTNGAPCGPLSQTCSYEDCAGAGRTIATCTASAWKVTTSPCATLACQGTSGLGLVCAAGMVCIITTSSGGAPITTPTCVAHTCGTGPITPQCVPSLYGTCTPSYTAAGTIFRCQLVAECGDAGCA
jgi:hypothetical protein